MITTGFEPVSDLRHQSLNLTPSTTRARYLGTQWATPFQICRCIFERGTSEIRTHDVLAQTAFETVPFDHSGMVPFMINYYHKSYQLVLSTGFEPVLGFPRTLNALPNPLGQLSMLRTGVEPVLSFDPDP
ncbi:putative ORFan [Tupanvirus deep ocean]|uniref:ORFan n=2 Tax=Tupanvirus TaxID=2094720 RepID=A0AC62A709_9VIRU|nr:putative ORFan [Tupanvirus deep ocean]QKU33575.1 putative ORFan [Tupanvirus deep ocean]